MNLTYGEMLDSIERVLYDDRVFNVIKRNINKEGHSSILCADRRNEAVKRLEERGYIRLVYVSTLQVSKPYYKVYILK